MKIKNLLQKFIHIALLALCFTSDYSVESYGTNYIFFVTINLGFKMLQRINIYLRQIVSDLVASGDLPGKTESIRFIKNPLREALNSITSGKFLLPKAIFQILKSLPLFLNIISENSRLAG